MTKINIILDRRYKRKDNTFPLKISIYRHRTLYIPIYIYIKEEEWDKVRQQIIGSKYRNLNIFINQKKTQIQTKIISLQNQGLLKTMSDAKLIEVLSGDSDDEKPCLFRDYMERYVGALTNKRTQEIYIATEIKVKRFAKDYSNLTFEDMNVSWLRDFDKWLSKDSPSVNARAIHLRNIRTIFNAAIDDEAISCYPFRRFRIKYEETSKRSITVDEMRKFRDMPIEDFQVKYRDCFFLMFYLIGINIADLSKLTEVTRGRITYIRSKTHKTYSIKVEPEAQAIIDRYRGKDHLLCWFDSVKSYTTFAMHLNRQLGKMSEAAGLPHMTTYVARHSWSTFASEIDISRDVISHALGHHATVTDTYIRYNYDKVDNANRKVIDYLNGTVPDNVD